ncbi:PREDICTED: uncharacterized protein LOC106813265 [Priapulus caudatus]|uniref:Uncharacterized protein LOC106813265 n=1 Tax=Priapulus caudatus TaxID=37621 RepID=A0ABM1EKX8_PRICU|nr:PREDICTED: uncharacterized protein LOC106813265 [Priapulus caudatus]
MRADHRPTQTSELDSTGQGIGNILVQMLKDTRAQQQSLVEALQLQKTEMMSFDGDPLKYWGFIRAFENIVDKDTISSEAKLARLLQYSTGPTRKQIQCCSVMEPAEGYAHARSLLKSRFVSSYLISEAWIEKINRRPDVNGSKALRDYADDLRICRETLSTMGNLGELNNSRSLLQIAEKLPMDLRRCWTNKAYHIRTKDERVPNIDDMVEYVDAAADQANDPVFGKLVQEQQTTHRAHSAMNPTGTETPCHYCGGRHSLFDCNGFKSLRPGERLDFVQIKVRGYGAIGFMTTYALLDSGSTQSFCSEELVKRLGVLGRHNTITLTTLDNKDVCTDTHVVSLKVADLENENLISMSHVLTRPKLHISSDNLVTRADLDRWPHLQDITIPDINTKEVYLLIGQDNPAVLIFTEVREKGSGARYATKTILGWTLNGPMKAGPSTRISSHWHRC